jgi:hypothetical protein
LFSKEFRIHKGQGGIFEEIVINVFWMAVREKSGQEMTILNNGLGIIIPQ